jgi:hypothetical protein
LVEHLRSLKWVDADGQDVDIEDQRELLDYFYNEDYFYYTTFDDDEEI